MSIFKCKMCGGQLAIEPDTNVCECEYCGSKQTIPTADNEKKMTLFTRANRLRFHNEFDKAYSVYESIVAEFPEEAEAYWGLVLCKYGIEYVDDPATAKKVPTCHRSSFDSIMDDPNFEMVMEYAEPDAKRVYRTEAKQIEELRKRIVEISGKEEPYDIFICYKETDENGERTLDSVLAQDVYDALTEKGYRVFFSRITLEDKLGQEYEPYIFAALHSAKVMLAFGTDYEYYEAVWVKNEWSRFLQLIAQGERKTLIPCYKDIDAYDMPKEFARLQAQDMGKVGAIQDLLRGIEKIIGSKSKNAGDEAMQQVVIQQSVAGNNIAALLKRGNMALEDCEWEKADDFFEQVLNQDAECADAFWGKAMAQWKGSTSDMFAINFILGHSKIEMQQKSALPDLQNEFAAHIEQQIQKYTGEGYLNVDEIQSAYHFSFAYESEVEAHSQNKRSVLEAFDSDRNLMRFRKYTKDNRKFSSMRESLENRLQQKIDKAVEQENALLAAMRSDYESYIEQADKTLENLRKEKVYQEIQQQWNSAARQCSIEAGKRARSRMEEMAGFERADEEIAYMTTVIELWTKEAANLEMIHRELDESLPKPPSLQVTAAIIAGYNDLKKNGGDQLKNSGQAEYIEKVGNYISKRQFALALRCGELSVSKRSIKKNEAEINQINTELALIRELRKEDWDIDHVCQAATHH